MNKKFLTIFFLVFVLSITGCAKEETAKQDSVPRETVETPVEDKIKVEEPAESEELIELGDAFSIRD